MENGYCFFNFPSCKKKLSEKYTILLHPYKYVRGTHFEENSQNSNLRLCLEVEEKRDIKIRKIDSFM